MGRPATGQTPGHTVRIPTPVWGAAEERVGKKHMAALITRLLERDNAAAARRAARETRRESVESGEVE